MDSEKIYQLVIINALHMVVKGGSQAANVNNNKHTTNRIQSSCEQSWSHNSLSCRMNLSFGIGWPAPQVTRIPTPQAVIAAGCNTWTVQPSSWSSNASAPYVHRKSVSTCFYLFSKGTYMYAHTQRIYIYILYMIYKVAHGGVHFSPMVLWSAKVHSRGLTVCRYSQHFDEIVSSLVLASVFSGPIRRCILHRCLQ